MKTIHVGGFQHVSAGIQTWNPSVPSLCLKDSFSRHCSLALVPPSPPSMHLQSAAALPVGSKQQQQQQPDTIRLELKTNWSACRVRLGRWCGNTRRRQSSNNVSERFIKMRFFSYRLLNLKLVRCQEGCLTLLVWTRCSSWKLLELPPDQSRIK